MKHKALKRSISNKQTQQNRSSQTQTKRIPTPILHTTTSSSDKTYSSIESLLSDSYSPCLKPHDVSKSLKIIKRDLLRCSNQRPSLLGLQTIQTHFIHQGSQPTHSVASSSTSSSSSSSVDNRHAPRRRSLSLTSRTFHSTIDRIGPWPDKSINCFSLIQTNTLQPLKKIRIVKNARPFSPKSFSSTTDNTHQFKYYPSRKSYVEEYRKTKGYVLSLSSTKQHTSLSLVSSTHAHDSDDDQLSTVGTYSGGTRNSIIIERTYLSTTNASSVAGTNSKIAEEIIDHTNRLPLLPVSINHVNIGPLITNRHHSHTRPSRRTQHHLTRTLPPLSNAPLHYLSAINPIEKFYDQTKKVTSTHHKPSKLFFINGRPKKSNRTSSSTTSSTDTKTTSPTQDYSELRTTGRSLMTTFDQQTSIAVYRLPHRANFLTTRSDVGPLS